jgi:uncharacterized Zn finger protein
MTRICCVQWHSTSARPVRHSVARGLSDWLGYMNWRNFERKPNIQEQRRKAIREGQRLAKRGQKLSPVIIEGPKIAGSFWGKAWCENLESYRDYEYRLPRGRSYVRNGAVLDLIVNAGKITALVAGSGIYEVEITIRPLSKTQWSRIKTRCAGQVGSLIELLEGRLSDAVMRITTHPEEGLFPKPAEIRMECSCPDVATMCKHVAAVLYGVGARLDHHPDLLFMLRKVEQAELIAGSADFEAARRGSKRKTIADDQLADVFGIEIAHLATAKKARRRRPG